MAAANNDICTRRLTRELRSLVREPITSPKIVTAPLETNILEWHYVIEGSPGTPYAGGLYHGKLIFPKQYPLKPPSVIMCTPSGRFATNRRLCLSMSDFHPETWNPMWSVSTILTGLYSFMLDSHPTSGSIETTTMQKRKLAAQSLAYNVRDKVFCELFPEYVELHQERVAARRLANPDSSPTHVATTSSSSTLDHPNGHDLNTLLTATAGLVALVSIALAMLSYFF